MIEDQNLLRFAVDVLLQAAYLLIYVAFIAGLIEAVTIAFGTVLKPVVALITRTPLKEVGVNAGLGPYLSLIIIFCFFLLFATGLIDFETVEWWRYPLGVAGVYLIFALQLTLAGAYNPSNRMQAAGSFVFLGVFSLLIILMYFLSHDSLEITENVAFYTAVVVEFIMVWAAARFIRGLTTFSDLDKRHDRLIAAAEALREKDNLYGLSHHSPSIRATFQSLNDLITRILYTFQSTNDLSKAESEIIEAEYIVGKLENIFRDRIYAMLFLRIPHMAAYYQTLLQSQSAEGTSGSIEDLSAELETLRNITFPALGESSQDIQKIAHGAYEAFSRADEILISRDVRVKEFILAEIDSYKSVLEQVSARARLLQYSTEDIDQITDMLTSLREEFESERTAENDEASLAAYRQSLDIRARVESIKADVEARTSRTYSVFNSLDEAVEILVPNTAYTFKASKVIFRKMRVTASPIKVALDATMLELPTEREFVLDISGSAERSLFISGERPGSGKLVVRLIAEGMSPDEIAPDVYVEGERGIKIADLVAIGAAFGIAGFGVATVAMTEPPKLAGGIPSETFIGALCSITAILIAFLYRWFVTRRRSARA